MEQAMRRSGVLVTLLALTLVSSACGRWLSNTTTAEPDVVIPTTQVVSTVGVPATDPPPEAPPVVGEAIEPTVTLGSNALWPEPLDPGGPEAVAQRFASEVLGWDDALVTVAPEDPQWVTIARTTASDVELPEVSFLVLPIGGGWGVDEVGGPVPASTPAEPEGWTAFGLRQVPGAARVVVHIADRSGDTRAWQADLADGGEWGSIAVPDLNVNDIESVLVTYHDAAGAVIVADGRPYGNG